MRMPDAAAWNHQASGSQRETNSPKPSGMGPERRVVATDLVSKVRELTMGSTVNKQKIYSCW